MRCIYFDAIRIESIEGIVKSIYEEIKTLEDLKFLIKHSPVLFPKRAVDIKASEVHANLVALQER